MSDVRACVAGTHQSLWTALVRYNVRRPDRSVVRGRRSFVSLPLRLQLQQPAIITAELTQY